MELLTAELEMMSNTGSHSCYGLQPASTALEDLLVTYFFLHDQMLGLSDGGALGGLVLMVAASTHQPPHRILQSLFSVMTTADHPCFGPSFLRA